MLITCEVNLYHVKLKEFRVGIGIDYGKMKVYKVGLPLKAEENIENKNFVWIGEPANFASRLTDMANKKKKNVFALRKYFRFPRFANGKWITQAREVLNADQLADRLPALPSEGVCNIEVEKHDIGSYSSILITDSVYEGLKKQDPHRNSIEKNFWKEAEGDFRGVTKNVYEANLIWRV